AHLAAARLRRRRPGGLRHVLRAALTVVRAPWLPTDHMSRRRSDSGIHGVRTDHHPRRSGLGPDREGDMSVPHHPERCPEALTPAGVVAAAHGGRRERDRLVAVHMPAIRAI